MLVETRNIMLQTIRDKSQGWIATVILGLVSFSFALWGIHYYLTQSSGTNIVAKVNGTKISEKAFDSVYKQLQQQAQSTLGADYSDNEALQNQLKKQALDEIINSQILAQALKKQGFYVSTSQLDELITQIPSFQENGRFSSLRFQQALASMSYSPQQFSEKLSEQVMISQLHKGIVSSGFALPDDVKQSLRLMLQKRDIGYVVVKRAQMKPVTPVTEEEVQAYYNSHKKQFTIPAKVTLNYITLSAEDLQKSQKVTTKEIQQYYQNNQTQFMTAEKWQVVRVIMLVDNNATKTDINNAKMKLMSIKPAFVKVDDISNEAAKINANVISNTWLDESKLSPLEIKMIAPLKPGMVSDPIQLGNQLEMIKLVAQKPGTEIPVAKVKNKIINMLQQQRAEKAFANKSDTLANLTYENPNSLKPAAESLSLPIQTTSAFAKSDKKLTGILANPNVVLNAFSPDVYQQGYNSTVINVSPTKQVVIRVAKKIPAKAMPFDSVKEDIKKLLTTQAQEQATKEFATKIANALASGKPGPEVAKQFDVTWHEKANVDRHQKHVAPKVLETIFNMQAPVDREHPTVAALALPKWGDYVAVAIYKVVPGNPDKMSKIQKEAFFEVIGNKYGNSDFQLYMESLRKKAKIKVYNAQKES